MAVWYNAIRAVLYSNTNMSTLTTKLLFLNCSFRKFTVFSVHSCRSGPGAAVLAACRFGNRKLRYARIRFVFQPLLAHCFGTFSIRSFPFFFLFWKLFQYRFQKNGECLNFAAEYEPHFELPENSVPVLHQAQYRNRHYGSETYTYFYATQNPELGISWTGKQRHGKTCPEIFMIVSLYVFLFKIFMIIKKKKKKKSCLKYLQLYLFVFYFLMLKM